MKCPNCGSERIIGSGTSSALAGTVIGGTCQDCGYIFSQGNSSIPERKLAIENMYNPEAGDIPTKGWVRTGWKCPSCERILSPEMSFCPFCSPKEERVFITTDLNTVPKLPVEVPVEDDIMVQIKNTFHDLRANHLDPDKPSYLACFLADRDGSQSWRVFEAANEGELAAKILTSCAYSGEALTHLYEIGNKPFEESECKIRSYLDDVLMYLDRGEPSESCEAMNPDSKPFIIKKTKKD